MKKDTVVIISEPNDVHALAVESEIKSQYDLDVRIVDMSTFPLKIAAKYRVDQHLSSEFTGGVPLKNLERVHSIWWRRHAPCRIPNNFFGEERTVVQAECDQFIQGVLLGVDCLFVNNPMRQLLASRKLLQLKTALNAGLTVPTTCITNDPLEALTFLRKLGRRAIYKRSGESSGPASRTSFVTPEIESRIESIRYCPTIFQEYVEAEADLRVVIIDGEIFAIKINSQSGISPEDCRFDFTVPYDACKLPPDVAKKILFFMKKLQLVYGAIDMRIAIDGSYYFLEINPSGQFLWLETKTEVPLVKAMANLLAKGKSQFLDSENINIPLLDPNARQTATITSSA